MRILLLLSYALCGCNKSSVVGLELKYAVKASYEKPLESCKKMADVTGFSLKEGGFFQSYRRSMKVIRQETQATGGNYVHIKRATTDGKEIDGTSYKCN